MKKIIPAVASLVPDKAECVFRGKIFDVYQWQQEMFDGSTAIFEMLNRPDTVTVLAVVDDKIIVLSDEQPHRKPISTPPGGRVDPEDESTLDAAKRELLEETGYTFSDWRLLNVSQPQEKVEHFCYAYLAYGSYTKSAPSIDKEGERITVHLNTFDEVRKLALSDEKRWKEQKAIIESMSLEQLLATKEYVGQEVDR